MQGFGVNLICAEDGIDSLISEIQIYEDRQSNGQWMKSIKFKLPIIEEDMGLSLDDDKHTETACLFPKSI